MITTILLNILTGAMISGTSIWLYCFIVRRRCDDADVVSSKKESNRMATINSYGYNVDADYVRDNPSCIMDDPYEWRLVRLSTVRGGKGKMLIMEEQIL